MVFLLCRAFWWQRIKSVTWPNQINFVENTKCKVAQIRYSDGQ